MFIIFNFLIQKEGLFKHSSVVYISNTLNYIFLWGVSTGHSGTQTHTPGSVAK